MFDEVEVDAELQKQRHAQPGYIEPSFPTIAGMPPAVTPDLLCFFFLLPSSSPLALPLCCFRLCLISFAACLALWAWRIQRASLKLVSPPLAGKQTSLHLGLIGNSTSLAAEHSNTIHHAFAPS